MEKEEELEKKKKIKISQGKRLYNQGALTQPYNGNLIFILQMISLEMKVTQLCLTLCNPRGYSPWSSPGKNTGGGSLSLLQGIFPTD